jgi:tetratricopeptide (TPR) repeat protein
MGSVVNAKLAALSGARTAEPRGATMGVRGAERGGAAVTWIEDEAGELINRGVALLAESRNREALAAFQQAVESSTDRDTEAAGSFYAAYTHDQLGEQAQAVRLIAGASPAATADYYRDFVLLKSRLLIETAAPAEALPLIDGYLAASPTGEGAQAAQMLAAFAYRALGDRPSAVARLEKSRDLAPASELGRRADALIAEVR